MADNNVAKKNPPTRRSVAPVSDIAFSDWQLSLFQGFLANTGDQGESLSNAVDLWDSIPRYSISRARMNSMRTVDGFLGVAELSFQYRGRQLTARIYPAQVRNDNGQWKSYYPSAR